MPCDGAAASDRARSSSGAAPVVGVARVRRLRAVADDQLDEPVVVEFADGHGCDLARPSRSTVTRSASSNTSSRWWETYRIETPRRSQAVDHVEQTLDVLARQRRRRLVEDQQAGAVLPADECAGDGDRRALRRRQESHGRLDVDVAEAEDRQRLAGAVGLVAPVDAAAEARRVAGRRARCSRPRSACRRARGPGARTGCPAAVAACPSPSVERLAVDPRLARRRSRAGGSRRGS